MIKTKSSSLGALLKTGAASILAASSASFVPHVALAQPRAVTQEHAVRPAAPRVDAHAPLRVRVGQGEPQARILFLHGLGDRPGNALMHRLVRQLEQVGAQVEIISPWLRAPTREHEAPSEPQTMSDQLRRVREVLDHTDGPVYLVGHSFGGRAALELAQRYPDRIKGVIALAPSVSMLRAHWKFQTGERGLPEANVIRRRLDRNIAGYTEALRQEDLDPEERDKLEGGRQYEHTMRDLIDHDEERMERSVRSPTLVLHGEADNAVSIHYARRFAEANAGSVQLVEYPNTDHGFLEPHQEGRRVVHRVNANVDRDIANRIWNFINQQQGNAQ